MTNGFEKARPWWPFEISQKEVASLRSTISQELSASWGEPTNSLQSNVLELDRHELLRVVTSDSLPAIAHLANGWGDHETLKSEIAKSFVPFFQKHKNGALAVLQCHEEGDFHPWQSFAYLFMAGYLADDTPDGWPCNLQEVALNSNIFGTGEGEELGHYLFGLSNIPHAVEKHQVLFSGKFISTSEVVRRSVEAHHFGHFGVCRKYHLTEGICTISRYNLFSNLRSIAQVYLSAQLDTAVVLAAAYREILDANANMQIFEQLCMSVGVNNAFVNHVFVVGHLMELAAVGRSQGLQIDSEHSIALDFMRVAIVFCLQTFRKRLILPEDLYQLAHFRRGMRMCAQHSVLAKLERSSFANAFSSNDHISKLQSVFEFPTDATQPPKVLLDACEGFEQNNHRGLHCLGKHKHFRRLLVPGWPRQAHFEFLMENDQISVEFHVEGVVFETVRNEIYLALVGISDAIPLSSRIDKNWHLSGQRLVVNCGIGPGAAEHASKTMATVIDTAYPILDEICRKITY
jgi:hypothetical protein